MKQSVIRFCVLSTLTHVFAQQSCLSDPILTAELELIHDGRVPGEGSCCQFDVCGLTCPDNVPPPSSGRCMDLYGSCVDCLYSTHLNELVACTRHI
jgi:hypothetical protein